MTEALRNTTLNEDERAALYGYLCRQERDQLAVIAEAEAKRKENFKKAKEWSFSKEEITFHEKARKAGEGSSIIKKHALHKTILIKLGFISDDRGGDLLSDRVDKLQLHNRRGYDDGLCGEGGPGASGFAANSDEDRAYMDGWKEGQRVYVENWQAAMEKAIAAKTNEEPPASTDADPFEDAA
jgi:hypothetical protein